MEPDNKCYRPPAFDKMEALVREMQDTEHGGVAVKSSKVYFQNNEHRTLFVGKSIRGYDMVDWMMTRFGIEENEAQNIGHQLILYGYILPSNETKSLFVKDDSTMYRFQKFTFQAPIYWPWKERLADNVEYAIYLTKRTLRKQQARHVLEEYESEAWNILRKNLAGKWDYIMMQAEEQNKIDSTFKKADKNLSDQQEKAFWRVHRPPPNLVSPMEQAPVPLRNWNGARLKKKTIESCKREIELLKNSLERTRVKTSVALNSLLDFSEYYQAYDPFTIKEMSPENPWVEDKAEKADAFWIDNLPLVDNSSLRISRVKRWEHTMEDLVSDPTGLREFTYYLKKEYSHENIRFWMAVNDLRHSAQSQILKKVYEIYDEFLAPGAPCEINIDGKTMEKVHQEMRTPSRFTFDAAKEHVYTMLLKKDCYPRFIRSEHYKGILSRALPPPVKKRFGGIFKLDKKKTSTTNAPNPQLLQQQSSSSQSSSVPGAALARRRGSDRSLSGSAHELAVSGVKDSKVPHSHSQSNLSDIPYRVKKPSIAIAAGCSTSEEVCPWEAAAASEPRSRKNSGQLDSGSSSSDISVALAAENAAEKLQQQQQQQQQRCILTQQNTVDGGVMCGGGAIKKLSAGAEPLRRASVSVPMSHFDSGGGSCEAAAGSGLASTSRRKVSSFEDNIATSSNAISSDSADNNKPEDSNDGSSSTSSKKPEDLPLSSGTTGTSSSKTLVKSHSLAAKTCSVSGANAPIISVSSAADDVDIDGDDENQEEAALQATSEPSCGHSEPLAPLAEPDCESPASELPPSEPVVEVVEAAVVEDVEAKANDVCPWEDEETCKVDTPFVKTYATLGYL